MTVPKLAISAAAAAIATAAGCATRDFEPAPWDAKARADTNEWTVNSAFDDQARRSVERRRTFHGHHFITGTDQLNPRGQREVATVAKHLAAIGGGDVYMPSSDAPADLDEKRRQAVRRQFTLVFAEVNAASTPFRILTETPVLGGEAGYRARDAYREPITDAPYEIHGNTQSGDN